VGAININIEKSVRDFDAFTDKNKCLIYLQNIFMEHDPYLIYK